MPCPECEMLPAVSAVETVPKTECCLCGSRSQVAVLWDAKKYCDSCIRSVSTKLVAAASNRVLSEELPYNTSEICKRALWWTIRFVGAFAAFWGVMFAVAAGIRDGVWFFGVWLMCGLPVICLWTLAASIALSLMKTKTMIWNGTFMVRMGSHLLIAPLKDISWREGQMSQHTLSKFGHLLRGPSLIVELPESVAEDGNCVAVGCTAGSMEIWRSFFTIAGIPASDTKPKKGWFSNLFRQSTT